MAVPEEFINLWQVLAKENGLEGICFIGRIKNDSELDMVIKKGFSYVTCERMARAFNHRKIFARRLHQLKNFLFGRPINCCSYKEAYPFFLVIKNVNLCSFLLLYLIGIILLEVILKL